MRKLATLSVFVLALVVVFSSASAMTQEQTVTICHATASESNPYIVNHPAADGDVSGHDSHEGGVFPDDPWGDIIPPFDYGDGQHYEGKNWTAAGQAIWENECEVPEVHDYWLDAWAEADCEQACLWLAVYDGDELVLGPFQTEFCEEWTDPYTTETAGPWTFIGYNPGEPYGSLLADDVPEISEPERCLQERTPKISVGSCIVADDNLFRIKIVAKGADGQYRLRGNSSGEIIGPFDLVFGDVVNGSYLGDPSTYTEDTWIKEFFNGEVWVAAGGTHVTSVDGHTRNEFFCPEEVVPTPTPPPHRTGGADSDPAPFVAGVAAFSAVILAVVVELKRRSVIA